MKILDIPQSGKRGQIVAFQSRFGLCLRQLVRPRNTRTPARQFMRGAFGRHSQTYSRKLSEEQMDRWQLVAAQVLSDPRLGQSGPLTGQQLFTSINSVRSRVNLPETLEVPARPVFAANPVAELLISNSGNGARLVLRLSGELNEDVMVFGQAPCSSGRRKRRNVAYLGLLPPPVDGLSDITDIYHARYGEPSPGTRVFIITCQQKDGWKALDRETSDIVPDQPQGKLAASETVMQGDTLPAETAPSGFPAPVTQVNSHNPLMHKGCTRDEQGIGPQVAAQLPKDTESETRAEDVAGAASGGGGGGDGEG